MRRKAGAIGLAAIAVGIVSSIACRQVVNFREEPAPTPLVGPQPTAQADPDAGAACGLGYGTSGCAACVTAHCCHESAACAAQPACAPFAACVGACAGDLACRAQCAKDSPPAYSDEGPALSACLVAQCENACGLTCGSLGFSGVQPDAAMACQGCIVANNGCDVARSCGASVDCAAYRLCENVRMTQDGKEACDRGNDAGAAQANVLGGITGATCSSACARGADWSCVGRGWGWPRPMSTTVTLTIQVIDYVTGKKFSGVDVSVCDPKDVACESPRAQGSTDATGSVVLPVPNPVDDTYLGLDGYVQLTSPDFVSEMYYWGFPLSEPSYGLTDSDLLNWKTSIKVLTLDDLTQLGSSLGLPYDPSLSLMVAWVTDCQFHFAPGVQFTTNPRVPALKEIYGLSAALTATDALGFATLVGVPTGSIDVIATPLALDRPSSRETVQVRAGWVTFADMSPTP